MAITFTGSTFQFQNVGTASTLPVARPPCQDGDVILVAVVQATVQAFVAPAGWTLVDTGGPSLVQSQTAVYVKVASNEPGVYNGFGVASGTPTMAAAAIAFRGVKQSSPVDVHAGANSTAGDSTIDAPSVTLSAVNEAVVALFGSVESSTVVTDSMPSFVTNAGNVTATASSLMHAAIGYYISATAGATGTITDTTSQPSSTDSSVTVGLTPDPNVSVALTGLVVGLYQPTPFFGGWRGDTAVPQPAGTIRTMHSRSSSNAADIVVYAMGPVVPATLPAILCAAAGTADIIVTPHVFSANDAGVVLTGLRATTTAATLSFDKTGVLVGNAATSAIGTLIPANDKAFTGSAATTTGGTATPNVAVILTGLVATATAGPLVADLVAQGLRATTTPGVLTPNVVVVLTGQQLTTTSAALGPALDIPLLGRAATTATAALGASTTIPLLGRAATATSGTSVPAIDFALLGQRATTTPGTLGVSGVTSNQALTGLRATLRQGAVQLPMYATQGDVFFVSPPADAFASVVVDDLFVVIAANDLFVVTGPEQITVTEMPEELVA